MMMLGFWQRREGSEAQAMDDSGAVRLILPVKFWSCSMGAWRCGPGTLKQTRSSTRHLAMVGVARYLPVSARHD